MTTVRHRVEVDLDDLIALTRIAHRPEHLGDPLLDEEAQFLGCTCGAHINEDDHPAHVEWCARQAAAGRIELA